MQYWDRHWANMSYFKMLSRYLSRHEELGLGKKILLNSLYSLMMFVLGFPKRELQVKRCGPESECLKDFYRTFGPEKFPVPTFSYWNLINELPRGYKTLPDIQQKLNEVLKRCPTVTLWSSFNLWICLHCHSRPGPSRSAYWVPAGICKGPYP